jgi:hypothetical protein
MPKTRQYPDPKEQLARAVRALRRQGYTEDEVAQQARDLYWARPEKKRAPWGLHPGWNGLNPPGQPGQPMPE